MGLFTTVFKSVTKSALPLGALVLAAVSPGCLQQDTTGDSVKQEQNREKAAADTLQAQNLKMKGQFVGSINTSDILMTLDAGWQPTNGNGDLTIVPQPLLTGTLQFTPRVSVSDSGGGHSADQNFQITGGQYVDGNDLTLSILVNGNTTTAHCGVVNLNTLNCTWYPGASTGTVSFMLTRLTGSGGSQIAQKRDIVGIYSGSNSDAAMIHAQFTSVEEPQSGSVGMPMFAVAGSFCIAGKPTADQPQPPQTDSMPCHNFPFTDGQFDPISSTLAIKIPGTNPIVVNCAIKTETTMHCVWVGTNGPTSIEEFDLQRSN